MIMASFEVLRNTTRGLDGIADLWLIFELTILAV